MTRTMSSLRKKDESPAGESLSSGFSPIRAKRSPSEMLVELHIYLIPKDKWSAPRRLARNQVVEDTVSVGFVRVIPELTIHNLRREILLQLGPDVIPSDYVFVRSVGRNFTQVKLKQEHQLKVKNFAPPYAPEPEIYLLEPQDGRESIISYAASTDTVAALDSASIRLSVNRKSEKPLSPHPTGVKSITVAPQLNNYLPPLSPTPDVNSPQPTTPFPPTEEPAPTRNNNARGTNPSSEDSGISGSPHLFKSRDPNRFRQNLQKPAKWAENVPADKRLGRRSVSHPREGRAGQKGRGRGSSLDRFAPSRVPSRKLQHEKRNKRRMAEAQNPKVKWKQGEEKKDREKEDDELSVTVIIMEDDRSANSVMDGDHPKEGAERDKTVRNPSNDTGYKILETNGSVSKDISEERLLVEINEVLRQRREAERKRHLLVEKATELQAKVRDKREKSQQAWKERLLEARQAAIPLEDSCQTLRLELDAAHRQLLANLEGREVPIRVRDGPSKKANYKITAARLQHEIKDLQQRVNNVELRLDSEMKLKKQAEREVRQLRHELSQKKSTVSTIRSQLLGTVGHIPNGRNNFLGVNL